MGLSQKRHENETPKKSRKEQKKEEDAEYRLNNYKEITKNQRNQRVQRNSDDEVVQDYGLRGRNFGLAEMYHPTKD